MAAEKNEGKDDKRDGRATRRLLTRAEAAAYLSVSAATLSRWAHLRCGPKFVKLTSAAKSGVRYSVADLDAFIESRSRSTDA